MIAILSSPSFSSDFRCINPGFIKYFFIVFSFTCVQAYKRIFVIWRRYIFLRISSSVFWRANCALLNYQMTWLKLTSAVCGKKNQILHFLKNQYPVCTLYIGPQEAIFVCFCSFISLSLQPFGENLGCNPGIIVDILFIGSVWMFLKHPGSFSLSYITKRVIFWHASELRSNTLWWYLFSFLLLHCSPLNAYDARRDFVCVKKSLISYSLTIFAKLSLNSADRLSWNIFFIHKLQIDT